MTAAIDPDCRDGKHTSCVGDPCTCICHQPGATVQWGVRGPHATEGALPWASEAGARDEAAKYGGAVMSQVRLPWVEVTAA